MKMTSGTLATTRLTKRQQLEEDKECGQILLTAEVIMKNKNHRQSLGNNEAHKNAAAGGRQCVRTAAPNSSSWRKAASAARSSQQQRSI